MRYPIYPVGADSSTPWILKKKINYISHLIETRAARWIDESNPALGVVLLGRYVIRRPEDSLNRVAGSGFDTAWHIQQSGYAGPLVWELNSSR